jgi:hypothetical protein
MILLAPMQQQQQYQYLVKIATSFVDAENIGVNEFTLLIKLIA